MRHIRLIAATGTAVAALALTACDNGTGTEDEGAARSKATVAAAETNVSKSPESSTPAKDTTGTGAGAGTDSGATEASPVARTDAPNAKPAASVGRKGQSTGRTVVLCNGTNTSVTAQLLSRPLNHMLLTVKNTGGKTCDLPYYPVLRFDQMQWVPQADESTQPQSVVSLAPGQSAYAGVLLSAADGSGSGGMTAHKLTVGFQGMSPNSDGGPSATPALPAKGVYYDSTLKVTYWQSDLDAISNW
ncbi:MULTISPECIES: DUF4232 domain-containing protein [Streptomyces]|uniref:DUF4232 domain-containing protein n=1 Tax=Streptomyces TaxID=1883 RepID=UPI001675C1AF|nr:MULTISPECIES: DUF4232 domain-containing protein [Streptomyces]MBK3520941.1 DUF4232 domain-containing protein [Streptomyces sp. MBT70]